MSFAKENEDFMSKHDRVSTNITRNPIVEDVLDSHVTQDKMKNAIQTLKGNNICGLDGLLVEILKKQASLLCNPLCLLFNYMFDKGESPKEWAKVLTIPISKGGDKNKPENYRRVTMLPLLEKLFETIVNIRLLDLCQVKMNISFYP